MGDSSVSGSCDLESRRSPGPVHEQREDVSPSLVQSDGVLENDYKSARKQVLQSLKVHKKAIEMLLPKLLDSLTPVDQVQSRKLLKRLSTMVQEGAAPSFASACVFHPSRACWGPLAYRTHFVMKNPFSLLSVPLKTSRTCKLHGSHVEFMFV